MLMVWFMTAWATCMLAASRIKIPADALAGKSGLQLYFLLKGYHEEAAKQGARLTYPKRLTLALDIPEGATTLPLSEQTDFNGCRLVVLNTTVQDFFLFSLANEKGTKPTKLSHNDVNTGYFGDVNGLREGLKLLVLKDQRVWTDIAPEEGGRHFYRQDVLLVKNGKALNTPILPYDNSTSEPQGQWYEITASKKTFKDLTFERSARSTCRTRLLQIKAQNNVCIQNVTVLTPFVAEDSEAPLYRTDRCICVENSACTTFENVTVRGTYSTAKCWGYAINLENVFDTCCKRLYAEGHWGIFGNNNVNRLTINQSRINRVDLHCYGRDIICCGCIFSNTIDDQMTQQHYCASRVLNTFASLVGSLTFDRCQFRQALPLYLRANYRAYTGYDATFRRCQIDLPAHTPYIVTAGLLNEPTNTRQELSQVCWPNINVERCTIRLGRPSETLEVFHVLKNSTTPSTIGHLSVLAFDRVNVVDGSGKLVRLKLSNVEVKTVLPLKVVVRRSNLHGEMRPSVCLQKISR